LSLKEKLEGKSWARTTRIGSEKSCPLRNHCHCFDDCEWNDGEGCAVWRLVKAAEHIVRSFQDFQRGDSK